MKGTQSPDLGMLMPMNLRLSHEGKLISMGPTLRRICGGSMEFDRCFLLGRSDHDLTRTGDFIARAREGRRIFLRPRSSPDIILRGSGMPWAGGVLLNLGLGNSLVRAVTKFALTDSDFSPSELALEILFLYEANQAVIREIGNSHRRLASAHETSERLALTDPLTGLLNRRGFAAAAEAMVASGAPFCLIQLDLDRFKEINDLHGHAAGDAALIHVASVLRSETRIKDRIARLGGDEFAVLLADTTSSRSLCSFKRRLMRKIAVCPTGDGKEIQIGLSLGLSCSHSYAEVSIGRMLSDADKALYRRKARQGRFPPWARGFPP